LLREVQQQTSTDTTATDETVDEPPPDSQQQQSHAAAMLKTVRSKTGGGESAGSRVSLGMIGTILGVVAILLLGLLFLNGSAGGMVGQNPTETATATTTATPTQPTATATPDRPDSTDIPVVPPATVEPTAAPTSTSAPRPTAPGTPVTEPTNTRTTAPTDTAEPTITPTPFATALINVALSNLRTEPRIAPETSIGVACAGDRALVFEQRRVPEFVWYRMRITAIADEDCSPERVAVGTEGWMAGVLLVLNPTPTPTPPPTNTPTPTNTATPTATPTTTPTPFATALIDEDRSNLRAEPRIASETLIGVACAGDRAQVFEERQIQEFLWYRIRITGTVEDCSLESDETRVETGAEGWMANFLVVLNPTPTIEGYPPP
jgi:hypothetical protein